MSIPVSTTTVTVKRPTTDPGTQDPWETPAGTSTLATGIRAVISPSSGSSGAPGDTEVVEFKLVSDPTDIDYLDQIVDEFDDKVYEVVWAITTPGIAGLGHTAAGLKRSTGLGS